MVKVLTDLSGVRRSVAEANGLPNAHYTDPRVFEEEKQRMFFPMSSSVTKCLSISSLELYLFL